VSSDIGDQQLHVAAARMTLRAEAARFSVVAKHATFNSKRLEGRPLLIIHHDHVCEDVRRATLTHDELRRRAAAAAVYLRGSSAGGDSKMTARNAS
jgi:hypothetical protein